MNSSKFPLRPEYINPDYNRCLQRLLDYTGPVRAKILNPPRRLLFTLKNGNAVCTKAVKEAGNKVIKTPDLKFTATEFIAWMLTDCHMAAWDHGFSWINFALDK